MNNFIQLTDTVIELTEQGFLKDRTLWNESIAKALADKINLSLTGQHWQIIYFARNFYQQFETIPPLRIFIKNLAQVIEPELANSIALHKLFPESPLKTICMIGGLPKPKHCM